MPFCRIDIWNKRELAIIKGKSINWIAKRNTTLFNVIMSIIVDLEVIYMNLEEIILYNIRNVIPDFYTFLHAIRYKYFQVMLCAGFKRHALCHGWTNNPYNVVQHTYTDVLPSAFSYVWLRNCFAKISDHTLDIEMVFLPNEFLHGQLNSRPD